MGATWRLVPVRRCLRQYVAHMASPTQRRTHPWTDGTWLNPPVATAADGEDLLVTAAEGNDFWRTTAYGFIRDSGHALLADLATGSAMEVSFVADLTEPYDQAGLFVRVDESHWIKAGIEVSDGEPHLVAVATRDVSDWSLAPAPGWSGEHVTVRASRSGDAIAIRARAGTGPWRLMRLAPLDPDVVATAGPLVCGPMRPDLTVRFTGWRTGPADVDVHDPGLD